MGVAAGARSSRVQWDGASLVNHQLARTAFSSTAAVDNVSSFVAPCNLTIVQFLYRVLTSGTASAKFVLGNTTTASSHLAPTNVKNVAAGTVTEIPLDSASWVKRTIAKGEVIKLKLNQSTAGSPVIAGTIVFQPTVNA